jgi:protein gp37
MGPPQTLSMGQGNKCRYRLDEKQTEMKCPRIKNQPARGGGGRWPRPSRLNVDILVHVRRHMYSTIRFLSVGAKIRECWRLDWLLLTKRPQNIRKMLPDDWGDGYRNVWLGVTAENQAYFDQRWSILQRIPAAVRFISYEPAVGPLRSPRSGPIPDGIISGGESGGGARPLDPQWIRDIIADCRRLGVVPFHKQWGTYRKNPFVVEEGMTIEGAKGTDPFGKGGGLLDGEIVREFPLPRRLASRDAA